MARYDEQAKVFANLIKDKNRLKAQISKPSNTITYLKGDVSLFRSVIHPCRMKSQNIGHALIVGHPTNGKIGNGYNGIDGEQIVIGSQAFGAATILSVVNPEDTFYEDFSFDLYVNSSNTTATLNTSSKNVTLDAGEILESELIYKNSNTITGAKLTSDNSDLSYYMSADNGSNWESVTLDTTHNFTDTGTELLYRATNGEFPITNLVLYYRCDTDGSFPDASGNGYTGTINGATYTSAGKINGCYSFDGNDSIVTSRSGDIADGQAFSIGAWIYPTTTGAVVKKIFDNTGDGGTRDNERATLDIYDGDIRLYVKDSGSKTFTLTSAYSINNWYYVVATFDGTGAWKLYVNGSLVDSDTQTTAAITPGEDYTIGANAESTDDNFVGKIDEIFFTYEELSSSDVTTLYNGSSGLPFPSSETLTRVKISYYF